MVKVTNMLVWAYYELCDQSQSTESTGSHNREASGPGLASEHDDQQKHCVDGGSHPIMVKAHIMARCGVRYSGHNLPN